MSAIFVKGCIVVSQNTTDSKVADAKFSKVIIPVSAQHPDIVAGMMVGGGDSCWVGHVMGKQPTAPIRTVVSVAPLLGSECLLVCIDVPSINMDMVVCDLSFGNLL